MRYFKFSFKNPADKNVLLAVRSFSNYDEIWEKLKDIPNISHFCIRNPDPAFNYNLFFMVHTSDDSELEKLLNFILKETKALDFKVLRTLRVYKSGEDIFI